MRNVDERMGRGDSLTQVCKDLCTCVTKPKASCLEPGNGLKTLYVKNQVKVVNVPWNTLKTIISKRSRQLKSAQYTQDLAILQERDYILTDRPHKRGLYTKKLKMCVCPNNFVCEMRQVAVAKKSWWSDPSYTVCLPIVGKLWKLLGNGRIEIFGFGKVLGNGRCRECTNLEHV